MALVLSVGESESVWIGSAKVTIVRTGQHGGNVKLAIEAPRETNIVRDEVKRRDAAEASFRQWQEENACKVCGNVPDESGALEHGRGCYTQSEDGGGTSFVDLRQIQPRMRCRCGHTADRHDNPEVSGGEQNVGCKYCRCEKFEAAITSQIQPSNVDDLGRRSEGL